MNIPMRIGGFVLSLQRKKLSILVPQLVLIDRSKSFKRQRKFCSLFLTLFDILSFNKRIWKTSRWIAIRQLVVRGEIEIESSGSKVLGETSSVWGRRSASDRSSRCSLSYFCWRCQAPCQPHGQFVRLHVVVQQTVKPNRLLKQPQIKVRRASVHQVAEQQVPAVKPVWSSNRTPLRQFEEI